MPTLSMFFGILIRMYKELNGQHNVPHFHAGYGEYEAVYDFDGNVLEGKLPKKQHNLVVAWVEIHYEELEANWKLLCENEPFFKIEPLRQEDLYE